MPSSLLLAEVRNVLHHHPPPHTHILRDDFVAWGVLDFAHAHCNAATSISRDTQPALGDISPRNPWAVHELRNAKSAKTKWRCARARASDEPLSSSGTDNGRLQMSLSHLPGRITAGSCVTSSHRLVRHPARRLPKKRAIPSTRSKREEEAS